ncbi:MAG: hypothetical protein K2X27_09535 [Candidatus Obscuribacterales bacterium]|nr:hypothetical protein [Candidatus Obscuribacterales bacterium]
MKSKLISMIEAELKSKERFLLGICGAPGAGKSTLAAWLVEAYNELHNGQAVLVPMDGYHLSNEELERRSLLALKGIPETFDGESFLAKIEAIKSYPAQNHFCPRFDRSIEASIENEIKVFPEHKLIVVEGNYLLLESPPWVHLKQFFDQVWFISANENLLLPRLQVRHQLAGRSPAAAREKLESTDLPNAKLVAQSKARADFLIEAEDLHDPSIPAAL